MSWFHQIFPWLIQFFAVYFIFANTIFLFLLIASFFVVRRIVRKGPMLEMTRERLKKFAPSISIIAPAFNEEKTIVDSVKSFLSLDYSEHEVIIVNDGSIDNTLTEMDFAFLLEPVEAFFDARLSSSKVRKVYRSKRHSNLIVVDKENSGKADSINIGIGFARYDLFCSVDSDSILDSDSLLKGVYPFVENPEVTIAAGGTVRPVNGCAVVDGRVLKVRLSKNPIVLVQIVEYLRAFLFGRVGWNSIQSTLIISGAFGIFKKSSVIEVGGYTADTVGEDMELVVRLRRHYEKHDLPYEISFVPDPICWTAVPTTLAGIATQRERWQRGLAESLFRHIPLLFKKKYRFAGLLAFPYFFLVELFGPIIEILALLCVITGYIMGWINYDIAMLFIIADLMYGVMMSMGAIFIEESGFHKYPKVTETITLMLSALLEHLGFRQFVAVVRIVGLIQFYRGRRNWGQSKRLKFSDA